MPLIDLRPFEQKLLHAVTQGIGAGRPIMEKLHGLLMKGVDKLEDEMRTLEAKVTPKTIPVKTEPPESALKKTAKKKMTKKKPTKKKSK
jgi:hypothetical protein